MQPVDNRRVRLRFILGQAAVVAIAIGSVVVLRGRTRETDLLARLGGDEFAIVLPRCDREEARAVAEEIATAIREHVPQDEDAPRITASIGIATFGPDPETSFESVLAKADAAMYDAKGAGRDGVRLFPSRANRW